MAETSGGAPRSDAEQQAIARALSSPLRLRILRFCLHEARTNREIAAEFGLNPGTALHHVRTLVDTGFLAAGEAQRGTRGAREIPYRATGRSWRTELPSKSAVLLQTFLEEVADVPVDEVRSWRMGYRFDEATAAEFEAELHALIERYMPRDAGEGGIPMSFFAAFHPERRLNPPEPGRRPRRA